MLELQELYGCYNSTRIDLALDAGDEGIDLMREYPLLPFLSTREVAATNPTNTTLSSQSFHY